MYDKDKVAERIAKAEELVGWKLVRHTIEEVEKANKHLFSIALLDKDGVPNGSTVRPFTDAEKWWIRNERMLCTCDADYFLTRYAYLKAENRVFRFKWRNPQRVYFNIISALEKRGAAIQLIVLKGRQVGISTLTELLVTHRICFYYGVNAVIASSAQQPTKLMSQMMFIAYDNLPYWLKPNEKTRKESEQGELTFTNQSGVSFQHGTQTTGIARGHTPTCVHLSEVASYPNADELIDASLFRAVHESPEIFMVLESTAEGNFGWWYDRWRTSKIGWPKGQARLCPLFLPWYIATEMYPKPTWLLTRPIPDNWRPNEETRLRMAKAKSFIASSPLLSKVMGEGWEMPREQAWYSEVDFEEYRAGGKEKLWKQEMAGDDVECFQGGFDSVFGNDLLETFDENRDKAYKIYGLKGHGVEEKNEADDEDIDWSDDAERKIVRYSNNKGDTYSWELVPLRPNVIDEEDMDRADEQVDGKLLIFRDPEPGYDYTVGVDTGGGVGNDSTAIAVWRKGVRGMPDAQCAEFASAYLSHVEAYAFIMAISAYYARFMRDEDNGTQFREPLVSIEQIASVGDVCQPQMQRMGYGRFHRFVRYDTKKIQKKKSNKMGWFTSGWSRPILIDTFVHNVKNGWLTINSPFLLREMRKFEIHISKSTGREKLEHADGDHDDRIFSSAIAVFTSHDMDSMVERGKNRPVPSSAQHAPNIEIWPQGLVCTSCCSREYIEKAVGSGNYRCTKCNVVFNFNGQGGPVYSTKSDAIANITISMTTTRDLEDWIASERLSY